MRENNIKKDDNQINDVDANDKESEIVKVTNKCKIKIKLFSQNILLFLHYF